MHLYRHFTKSVYFVSNYHINMLFIPFKQNTMLRLFSPKHKYAYVWECFFLIISSRILYQLGVNVCHLGNLILNDKRI